MLLGRRGRHRSCCSSRGQQAAARFSQSVQSTHIPRSHQSAAFLQSVGPLLVLRLSSHKHLRRVERLHCSARTVGTSLRRHLRETLSATLAQACAIFVHRTVMMICCAGSPCSFLLLLSSYPVSTDLLRFSQAWLSLLLVPAVLFQSACSFLRSFQSTINHCSPFVYSSCPFDLLLILPQAYLLLICHRAVIH
ncbi:hypothetical protein AVEN_170610-1 [Araneus ventricosus]|uniref:Uncharacterized protein n=1 Tax=Araneus ventricosus TaxID=182803 RepID=A0A4Y2WLE2_ARAVE|nr:hypothetical protein AVEN_170610-1 [Araneus ventricosus]